MRPPLIARALLRAVAEPVCGDTLTGDLDEEFLLVCESNHRQSARRWYRWQVLRSVGPLLLLRLRSAELPGDAFCALLSVTLPLLLLDRLWSFVYSQIPLKDGVQRAPELLAVNLLAACAGADAVNRARQDLANMQEGLAFPQPRGAR